MKETIFILLLLITFWFIVAKPLLKARYARYVNETANINIAHDLVLAEQKRIKKKISLARIDNANGPRTEIEVYYVTAENGAKWVRLYPKNKGESDNERT